MNSIKSKNNIKVKNRIKITSKNKIMSKIQRSGFRAVPASAIQSKNRIKARTEPRTR